MSYTSTSRKPVVEKQPETRSEWWERQTATTPRLDRVFARIKPQPARIGAKGVLIVGVSAMTGYAASVIGDALINAVSSLG